MVTLEKATIRIYRGNHCIRSLQIFGHIDIFRDVTFGVAKGARFAIVGPNGIDKTTRLRILVGEDEATTGHVTRALAGVKVKPGFVGYNFF